MISSQTMGRMFEMYLHKCRTGIRDGHRNLYASFLFSPAITTTQANNTSYCAVALSSRGVADGAIRWRLEKRQWGTRAKQEGHPGDVQVPDLWSPQKKKKKKKSLYLFLESRVTSGASSILRSTKTSDEMDIESAEKKLKAMEHSEQHYFNRCV